MGLMDRFKREPTSRVRMVASVDQFIAGEQYDIPVEVADRFIARGYAAGSMSREYTPEEHSALHTNHQIVSV